MSDGTQVVDYGARRRQGLALYREIMMVDHPEPWSARSAGLIDFVFAEIWSRGVISRRERRLISLACVGGADSAETIGALVYGALASGDLSYDELQEVVLHFAVYCGWAKGEVLDRILDEQWVQLHAQRGTTPPPRGVAPLTTVAADQEQRKLDGEEEFRVVNCVPAPPRGIPYFEHGILTYVFGDMWKRPGLGRRDRRWVTLGCVGLDDAVIPIRSHVYAAMKSGDITHDEMREMVLQFAAYSGWPKASFLQQVVEEEHARVVTEAGA